MPEHTIREQLKRLRGVYTTPRINRFTGPFTTTSSVLLGQDPSRVFFLIVNLGGVDVVVAPISPAAANRGMRIPASGGALTAQFDEDGEVVSYEWQGATLSGLGTLFTLEAVIETPGKGEHP